ncbi:hypothetical protein E8E15_002708 [Penicillium rubens]|uniref:Uncharacterized protein n=1 Tax=Penicillium chrysogenum TaxID=5076 RepID=A0ABQ8WAF2_PENCH|nr:uncharacterized protein N7489_003681 [Penicillium chrysogenum]XP_061068058.1 uncharacterized protein N7525_011598 [Penicillium rubens]KAF3010407.1 hypothetical protein E8E15_002708 [Penicillium rubens]KAJ5037836.1 hypothetical protein NUH16_011437 [Penicillium rubens]KAJ5243585.1 hypothetical protein N7489_003681 [Penicillium chrysogenum]KAJ5257357.1 hypothetical protein N7524_008913 [Penicillium chrysogenum]KAJ5260733.1 hypothetical protein N7505_009083 [Penicillium chrysogenum]
MEKATEEPTNGPPRLTIDEMLERYPRFDPAEPQDLRPDVLWKIQFLKYMYRDGDDVDEEEWVNYHAVLNAYRSGHLDVDPDKVTVWFAGELKLGPFPRCDLKEMAISTQISEWRAELGHGRVWIEDFSLFVRLIGAIDFIGIDNVLADTGVWLSWKSSEMSAALLASP